MIRKFYTNIQSGKGITALYIILLSYIVLALIWWGVLLFRQSRQITQFERSTLSLRTDSLAQPVAYQLELQRIQKDEHLRTFKFFGEGATFMGIILLGAFFVYRAVWKQMRLNSQQQNFMMAVTHEFKSPIAVVKLNLETIRKHKLDEEKQRKLLDNTVREADRLNQLTNNILLAAQLESHKFKPVMEMLDLSGLLEHTIITLQGRITTHTIQAHILPQLWIYGDTFILELVINNIVENAVKYAPKDSLISVRLAPQGHFLHLEIADQGPGIPDSEKHKVFQKFYRIGNENTRKAKGSGLGLFLSERILAQHGARIRVRDNVPAGSIFEITWPSYSTQSA
ncbi:His Kinase A (phospho-acceptor) domain-containing protein [Chitinophaga costaii]|uniref:histidine kinase n=1 Tax=Chitinophaga costaii TaxID=1335309 RepID=A0A1C4AMS9_9BACT|nr:ATP-binding protein [Chitinophaga costaii]PUZ26672.1 two-component sensor histidine kinase [Chitinophaga costaii]SCB95904.1 His Kinase A (phospho-acceptor) domain-containing protein [Chitinophaga costaii]